MTTWTHSADAFPTVEAKPAETARPHRRTIMHVTWSLVAGGAETYALTVASNLSPDQYRAEICAMDQGGALEAEVSRLGLPYAIMHRRPGIEWGLMWRLFRLFRRSRVDVVHTHHFNQLFYSALGACLAGARIIHTEHSVELFKKRRYRIALRLLSLLCFRVVAIGSDSYQGLHEHVGIPARKLQVIRAGVNLEAYGEDRASARAALDIAPSARVAVIVARLSPEKNHRLLLDAFAKVALRLADAELLIVGNGVEEQAIREHIASLGLGGRVRMLGVRRDIPRILAASDVFVLSSDREGLPIAVLEAMAASRPVVATAVGDLPLVVREGQTGRLAERRNAESLSAAMIDLLSDPAQCQRLGAAGRQLVEEGYALCNMIEQHEALYAR